MVGLGYSLFLGGIGHLIGFSLGTEMGEEEAKGGQVILNMLCDKAKVFCIGNEARG